MWEENQGTMKLCLNLKEYIWDQQYQTILRISVRLAGCKRIFIKVSKY